MVFRMNDKFPRSPLPKSKGACDQWKQIVPVSTLKIAGLLESSPAWLGECSDSNQETAVWLKFESEADLSLSVRDIRTLRSHLPKSAVAYVVVRSVKLRSVEGVEVIHRENAREVFSNVEILLGIDIFQGQRSVSHPFIVPLGGSDDVLA